MATIRPHSRSNGRKEPNLPSSRRRPMPATVIITSTTRSTRSTQRRCCAREMPWSTTTALFRSESGPAAMLSSSRQPMVSTTGSPWMPSPRLDRRRAPSWSDTVSDAELKRMHEQGARGIRFNLAQAGATTPEMIEPLSKRVNALGWHIQINAPAAKIIEIMPILEKVPTPIVFDHLAHIPEPEGVNHPLFGQVRALIDKGKTWVKLSGAYADTKVGPPTYADSTAVAQAYAN